MCPAEHIHTMKAPSSLLMAEAISRSMMPYGVYSFRSLTNSFAAGIGTASAQRCSPSDERWVHSIDCLTLRQRV